MSAALAAGAVLALQPLGAQETEVPPLFASNDVVELVLEAPIRTLSRNRRSREELPGVVRYQADDGTQVALDIEVRIRGKSRLEICSFPPLSLNFRRGQVADTLFAGQNRLKLVTLCKDNVSFEQYLERERLAYRIYEQVSDYAYRVRPVMVTYVDTDRDNREEVAPAFLIEHTDGLAARTGMQPVEREDRIPIDELDQQNMVVLGLFHFLIANTDWSAIQAPGGEECCHNHDVVAPSADGPDFRPVPFDFDQSGFVNASYALPDERLGIRRVTQRRYRGFCATNELLPAGVERFNAARGAIEGVLESESLNERSREDSLEFLQDFYDVLNDPEEFEDEIIGRCRK